MWPFRAELFRLVVSWCGVKWTLTVLCTGLFEMIVGCLTTCHTQYTRDRSICIFLFNRTTLQVFVTYLVVCTSVVLLNKKNTGLFEMIVWVLTTCHKQYTWDRSICIFLFNRTTLQVFVTYLIACISVVLLNKKYRVIRNDCRGFNNLSYTIHLKEEYTYFFI